MGTIQDHMGPFGTILDNFRPILTFITIQDILNHFGTFSYSKPTLSERNLNPEPATKEGSKINGCLGGKFLLLFSWPSSKNLSFQGLEKVGRGYSSSS